MRIGFIGLGQMGKHMAMNMIKSKAEVVVNDLRTDSFAEFEKVGAKATSSLKEVAGNELIFLSLPNSQIVEKVVLGKDGLINSLKKGQIVVDLSTITYNTTIEIAERLCAVGVDFMDAPVSGMEARAADGTLTVMCGGKKEVFERVKPFLEYIGNKILYMGENGSGQLTKLINQLLFDINVAALAEILPMSVKMGLDPDKIEQVVNSGTGRSYASEFFIPRIKKGDFTQGYSMNNAYKDLVSAAELSAKHGIPMPVLHAATTTYQMALLKGYGDKDKGAMIRVYEEMLDVSFRS